MCRDNWPKAKRHLLGNTTTTRPGKAELLSGPWPEKMAARQASNELSLQQSHSTALAAGPGWGEAGSVRRGLCVTLGDTGGDQARLSTMGTLTGEPGKVPV